jgi:two-component system CheB/CheR fusion protein
MNSLTADLTDVLENVDLPILVLLRDFTIGYFNGAAGKALRLTPADIGQPAHDLPFLSGLRELRALCAQVIAVGVPQRHDLRDGDKSFVVRIAPYVKGDREINGTVLTFTNATAFRASIDQAIYEREFTKTILNTVATPLIVLDADLRVQAGNRAFYAIFGVSREQSQGVQLYELGNRAFDLAQLRGQLEDTLTGDREFAPVEVRHQFPGLGDRIVSVDARRLSVPRQSGKMLLLAMQDITEVRKAAEAQSRLVAELNHRVKNTLATVQAIASQTLNSATDEDRNGFIARLGTMARAHDALTEHNWDLALVRDILSRAIEPFQKERIVGSGPDVSLKPQNALMLTMVLHELATNAVKHGALSDGSGRVHVDWALRQGQDGARLRFCWEERGGPRASEPERTGFGTRMIAASFEEVCVKFAPAGVTCTFELAL